MQAPVASLLILACMYLPLSGVLVAIGIIMLSKFDEKFLKAVILVLWILPTSILFYILNSVATDDYFVFVCVIFGCNVVYDTSKKILAAPIKSTESALKIIKTGAGAIFIFLLSFVGVYLEATKAILPYIGIYVIWLPLYVWSLFLLSAAEKHYKATFGSGN